jgi:DNA gyrase subunit A
MATNIPPHNLGEIVEALLLLIQDPNVHDDKLLAAVKGPDFPTGGRIMGTTGIRKAYLTGHGRIVIRAASGSRPYPAGRASSSTRSVPGQQGAA